MALRRIALTLASIVLLSLLAVGCSMAGGAEEAEPAECAAVRRTFVHSAETQWWVDGVPSPKAVVTDLAYSARIADGEARAKVLRLRELVGDLGVEALPTAPRAQRLELLETWEELTAWAASVCPPQVPSWACPFQLISADFQQVDEPVDDGGTYEVPRLDDSQATTSTIPAFGDPEELVAELSYEGDPVPISSDGNRATYGWTDADGLVTDRAEMVVRNGEWVHLSTSRCVPASEVVDR